MMKSKQRMILLSGVSAIALVVSGCGGNSAKQEPTQSKEAQANLTADKIYANNCASCHGGNLQGGFGPSLEKIGSKLKKEQIVEIMQKGKGSMPSQGHISSQDQEKLAAWLAEKK
ncbi:cytochrome C' [Laceyella sacchari]|uniref:Cytochrome c551 n=1 Tax=Laceyella tengchongensis TaxID=574699 RepID=A0AA45WQY1_9BACL|nr:cytochrome c [Laceyella tengchongensis]AUS10155.1 cytochrome C' [Laceyella sacchari]SMP27024.1 cytochrome c551 [Laceyella tengchongensis]